MKHNILIERRKIIVRAKIRGVNEEMQFKFILDTGASKSIIDESVVGWLGFDLQRLESGDRLMTAGGSVNSKILKLPKFSLFGKDLVNFEVSVLKMPPQITYFIDGLIGMDFLLQFENLKFDFVEEVVET